MRFLGVLLAAALVCFTGCGVPGAPLPPSLGIPKTVNDLRAFRKGPKVTLTWTVPTEDTDGELIRKPGNMIVSRKGAASNPFQKVAEIPLQPALDEKQRTRASASDDVSSAVIAGDVPDFFFYRVVSISNRGRSSAPSNQAAVPAVLTAAPPPDITLTVVPQGITISFAVPEIPAATRLNSQFIFRIMRQQTDTNGAEPVVIAQFKPGGQSMPILDSRIEWEKHYTYWITPVTLWRSGTQQGEIEGNDSPQSAIFAHDVFPPATPSGLEAVFSGIVDHPAIDLTWTPNTEDDLAGYNVYRHTQDGQPVKINSELVKTPAFHDPNVILGETYSYSVTAVDLRGNESTRSTEASESVPRQ